MATNYLPSSGWYSTSNRHIFYRFKIDDSVSNGARSVNVTLQAYKSSSSTASTTTKGTFYMTINGTAYNLSIAQNTNFYADGTVRDYGSASPSIAIGTGTLSVYGYFDVSRFTSSSQGGSITLTPGSIKNTIGHWSWGYKNGEGNNGNKTGYKLLDWDFTQNVGDTFYITSDHGTTLPNGFYLNNIIGTSSVTGSWQNYTLGTSFTQKSSSMTFQLDYHPYTYNITYDLDGGINNANNPATYNVLYGVSLKTPTKDYNTFKGWEIQTEPKELSFYAGSSENYKYVRILSNIQPGVEYNITLNAKLNSGTATGFRILTYDFTSGTVLTESVTIPFGSNIVKTYTCPSNADASHDIAIIIYAGVNGSTAGNNVTYSDVVVTYRYATGINEGDNATFSSSSDLYTKLDARMTGNVTIKAIWEPWEHEVIFDYNGGYGEIPNNFIASSEDEIYLSDIQPKSLERTFIHWNTKSDGSGLSYKPGQLYNNYLNGGTITLYAMYCNPDIYLNSDNSIECTQFIEKSDCTFPIFEKGGIIIAKEFIEHDGKIMIQGGILYAKLFIEKDLLPGLAPLYTLTDQGDITMVDNNNYVLLAKKY